MNSVAEQVSATPRPSCGEIDRYSARRRRRLVIVGDDGRHVRASVQVRGRRTWRLPLFRGVIRLGTRKTDLRNDDLARRDRADRRRSASAKAKSDTVPCWRPCRSWCGHAVPTADATTSIHSGRATPVPRSSTISGGWLHVIHDWIGRVNGVESLARERRRIRRRGAIASGGRGVLLVQDARDTGRNARRDDHPMVWNSHRYHGSRRSPQRPSQEQ